MSKYTVEIDDTITDIEAASLAALANIVRGKGKRIRVWSSSLIPLIDTKFDDVYNLIEDKPLYREVVNAEGRISDALRGL